MSHPSLEDALQAFAQELADAGEKARENSEGAEGAPWLLAAEDLPKMPPHLAEQMHGQSRAIYVRVSRELGQDEGSGLRDQILEVAIALLRNGHPIAAVAGENVSGRRNDRPAVLQIIEHCAGHDIRGICAWNLDRITRHAYLGGTLLQAAIDAGCPFYYLPQGKGSRFSTTTMEDGQSWKMVFLELIVSHDYFQTLKAQTGRGRELRMARGYLHKAAAGLFYATIPEVQAGKAKQGKLVEWHKVYMGPHTPALARAIASLLLLRPEYETVKALAKAMGSSPKAFLRELRHTELGGFLARSVDQALDSRLEGLEVFSMEEWVAVETVLLRLFLEESDTKRSTLLAEAFRRHGPTGLDEILQAGSSEYRVVLRCPCGGDMRLNSRVADRNGWAQELYRCENFSHHARTWPKSTYFPQQGDSAEILRRPLARCFHCSAWWVAPARVPRQRVHKRGDDKVYRVQCPTCRTHYESTNPILVDPGADGPLSLRSWGLVVEELE